MTAADIRYGRQGGRRLHADHVVEGLIEPVHAVCPHGDRWLVAPSDIGTPCWRDGKVLVTDTVTLKAPEGERPQSVFFVDSDANLTRQNPMSPQLPLREVPRSDDEDLREAR